jgi:hypothetical protein
MAAILTAPASVRYSRGDHFYEANQYGANLLRQAVNYGYGGHNQYGTYVGGRGTILGGVLGTILNFQVIIR